MLDGEDARALVIHYGYIATCQDYMQLLSFSGSKRWNFANMSLHGD